MFVVLLFPSSAFAEVCDKEVPSWDFTTGPASQSEYFLSAATSSYGLTIIGLLMLALVLRRPWVHILCGILTLLVLLTMLSSLLDPIYAGSIREGCRASPFWVLVALTGVVLTFGMLAVRSWKAKAST